MRTKFNRTIVLLLLGINLTATSRRSTNLDADPIPNNNNTGGRPDGHDDDTRQRRISAKNESDAGESILDEDDTESAIDAFGESGNGNHAGISRGEEEEEEDIDGPRQEEVDDAVRHGLKLMRDLYFIKEPMLYRMGLFLDPDEPAGKVAAFSAPSSKAQLLARYGYATVQASLKIAQKYYKGQSRESTGFSDGLLLRTSILTDQCPLRGIPRCTPSSRRYRTPDGTCNNFNNPWRGSAMTPLQRFLPPMYEDGVQSPKLSVLGGSLPSPRDISITIHRDEDREMSAVTLMFMQWGQFLSHDVTSTAQARSFNGSVPRCCLPGGTGFLPPEFTHPECLPIAVPRDDWFLGHFGVRCLEFIRSAPSTRINCDLGWREQINQVTSYIDASTVYGSDAQKIESMRIFRGGQLQYGRRRTQGRLRPPDPPEGEICRTGAISTACFLGGDLRVGEQPALTSLHTIWLRYHNQLAEGLQKLNRHWSDEKLYQETRRIVNALVQHITYREFLPLLLGQDVIKLFELALLRKGYYTGYDDRINPTPANSFSTAAFRFGHSLVQNSFVRANINHRSLLNNVLIHEEQENPENIWSPGSLDRLILGMCNQASQRRDEFVSDELTNHLFQGPSAPFGMDLVAVNIQRGRDHGIPSYTAWREPCGLSPVTTWKDLERAMASDTLERFRRVYADVDDIDLYSGGLAERPVRGGIVGPTFACIIAQQFHNFRKGDRFWYENGGFESSFTPAQLQQIRKVNFAQIICHAIREVDTIQPFVFLAADDFLNSRVDCSHPSIGHFDLTAWDEIQVNSIDVNDNFDLIKTNIDDVNQFSVIEDDHDIVVIDDKIGDLITEDEFKNANQNFEVLEQNGIQHKTDADEKITLEITEQFSERLAKKEKIPQKQATRRTPMDIEKQNTKERRARTKRSAHEPQTKLDDLDHKSKNDRLDEKPNFIKSQSNVTDDSSEIKIEMSPRETKLFSHTFGRTNNGPTDITDDPSFLRHSTFDETNEQKTDVSSEQDSLLKAEPKDKRDGKDFDNFINSTQTDETIGFSQSRDDMNTNVDLDYVTEILSDKRVLRDNHRKIGNKKEISDTTDIHRHSRQILFDDLFDFYDDDDEDDFDDDHFKRSTETEKPPMSLYYHKHNSKPILIRRNASTNAKTYKPIFTFTNMTVRPNNLTSSTKNEQQTGRTNKTLDEEILRDFYNSHDVDDVLVMHNFLQGDDGYEEKTTNHDDLLTYDSDPDMKQNPPNYNVNINIQYFLQTTGRPTATKISKPTHDVYTHPIKSNVSTKAKPKNPLTRPYIALQTVPIYGYTDHHTTKPPKKFSTSYPIYVIQTSNQKNTTTIKPEGYDEVPVFVSGRPSGLDYVTTKRPYVYMRPNNQQTVIDEDYDPVYEDLTTKRPNRQPFPTQKPNLFGHYFPMTQKTTIRPVFPSYLYLTKAPADHLPQRPNQQVQKIDDKLDFKLSNLLPDRFTDSVGKKDFVKISSSQSLLPFRDKEGYLAVEKREDDFEQDHPDFLPIEDGLDVVKIEVMPSEAGSKNWALFNATEEFVDAVPELDVNMNLTCATELPRPMKLSERKPFRRRS